MQTIVASNLTLTVRPGPGVTLGDAPWLTATGSARQAFLGDLAAGETRDVFIPVRLGAHAEGAMIEVLDADLALLDVATHTAQSRHAFVGVRTSADPDALARAVLVDLATGRARANAAGVILQAIGLARQGMIDRAEQLLVDGERAARAAAEERGDDELAAMARRMVDIRKSLVFLRAAQLAVPVMPPPLGPPPLGRTPLGVVELDSTAPAPYPLERRATEQAPAAVEQTLKSAYDASHEMLRAPN